MVFATLFDPILNPLLSLHPALVIFIVGLLVSIITTVVTKYATNQTRLKSLKADMKRYQKKAKDAKDDPKKAMDVQKKILSLNGEYMRLSMKSTLYTFLPLILFFAWLGAHLAFVPLAPDVPFNVSITLTEGFSENVTLKLPSGIQTIDGKEGTVVLDSQQGEQQIILVGKKGTYDIGVSHSPAYEEFFSVIITEEQMYEPSSYTFKQNPELQSITIGYEKLLVFEDVLILGQIPWIKTFGWFGAYFLFSFGLTTALRRAFKVV